MSVKQIRGRWRANVHLSDGSRLQRTFDTKREADAFETKVRHELNEKKKDGTARYRMVRAIDDLEATKATLRPSSAKRYRPILNWLRAFCTDRGIEFVDQFTPDRATELRAMLLMERADPTGNTDKVRHAKPKTVNLFIVTYKTLFRDEVAKRHITHSPMAHIRSVPVERARPEFYTKPELDAFFNQRMPEAFREAFMGLLLTGMRFAELANLHWGDIDFNAQLIRIESRETHRTKTRNAVRAIPMDPQLKEMLMRMAADPRSPVYPFCTGEGNQLRERKMLAVCKGIAKRAGITSRAFLHKFRHTFATFAVRNGVSLEDLKELLGHASITETEVYAHHQPDHLHDKVRKVGKLLLPKQMSPREAP